MRSHMATVAGCTQEEYLKLRGTKAARAFQRQRAGAHHRGIGWDLRLWQWWTIWQESGHWNDRGVGQGYVMCRRGDVGPYAVGNVFIAPAIENCALTANKRSTLPIGVTAHGHKFRAKRIRDGKCHNLGLHKTPDLAHAAYLSLGPIGAQ